MPLTAHIKEFVDWKRTHAKKAVEPYNLWLTRFNRLINKPIGEIETEDITKFSEWVRSNYSMTTHYYAMTILHIFFNYQNRRGRGLAADLIVTKREHAKSHLPASESEYKAILNAFDEETFMGLRNKCMIALLGECGMRVSELADLNCADIDLREHFARIRTAKANRERRVVWSNETNNLLASYLAQRIDMSASSALFLGSHSDGTYSERITTRSVQRAVKKACEMVGIQKKISCHSLRHHFAIQRRRMGASIAWVQKALGHSSPQTTIDTYEAYGIDEFTDEARRYLDHKDSMQYEPLVRKLERQEEEKTKHLKTVFGTEGAI